MRTFDLRPGDMVSDNEDRLFVLVTKRMDPLTTDFTLKGFSHNSETNKWERSEFRVNWLQEWKLTNQLTQNDLHANLRDLLWESDWHADPNHNYLP